MWSSELACPSQAKMLRIYKVYWMHNIEMAFRIRSGSLPSGCRCLRCSGPHPERIFSSCSCSCSRSLSCPLPHFIPFGELRTPLLLCNSLILTLTNSPAFIMRYAPEGRPSQWKKRKGYSRTGPVCVLASALNAYHLGGWRRWRLAHSPAKLWQHSVRGKEPSMALKFSLYIFDPRNVAWNKSISVSKLGKPGKPTKRCV